MIDLRYLYQITMVDLSNINSSVREKKDNDFNKFKTLLQAGPETRSVKNFL